MNFEEDIEDNDNYHDIDENHLIIHEKDDHGMDGLSLLFQKLPAFIESGWQLVSSGVLIPDFIRAHPFGKTILTGVAVVLILLPVKLYAFLIAIGFLLGYSAFISVDQDSHTLKIFREKYDSYEKQVSGKRMNTETMNETPKSKLSITPKIDRKLDAMLDRLVKSVIDPWYLPQNKSGQREFQSCVRTSIDAAVMTLIKTIHELQHDSLTLFIYGLTNALVIHMQEFKHFEKSSGKSADFLASDISRRPYYGSIQKEVEHLKQIVSVLLKKLLPKQESKSIIVTSLMKEILASGALWNMMDRVCEPDFINMKIVEKLKVPVSMARNLGPGWNLVVIKSMFELICDCILYVNDSHQRAKHANGFGKWWRIVLLDSYCWTKSQNP